MTGPWSPEQVDEIRGKINEELKPIREKLGLTTLYAVVFVDDGSFRHFITAGILPLDVSEKRLAEFLLEGDDGKPN